MARRAGGGFGQPGQRISIFEGFRRDVLMPLVCAFIADLLGAIVVFSYYWVMLMFDAWAVPITAGLLLVVLVIFVIRFKPDGVVAFVAIMMSILFTAFMASNREAIWAWILKNTRFLWIPWFLWCAFVFYLLLWYFTSTIVDPYGPRPPMAVRDRTRPYWPWEKGDER